MFVTLCATPSPQGFPSEFECSQQAGILAHKLKKLSYLRSKKAQYVETHGSEFLI